MERVVRRGRKSKRLGKAIRSSECDDHRMARSTFDPMIGATAAPTICEISNQVMFPIATCLCSLS